MSADANANAAPSPLPPTGTWQEAVDEVLYGLHAVERYSLAVVVGPDDRARRALAAELAARHPERSIFREFRLEPGLLNPFEDFARAREWRDDYVTLVYGLETLSHQDLRKSLRLMNWNRGMLQRGNLRVVLWIPAHLEETVLEHASDLVDWWTVYVALPNAPEIREWDAPAIRASERLEQLHLERERREARGEPTASVVESIMHIRRRLRSGGELAPGDRVGRYRLVEVAGVGGFATVWKAWDRLTARVVAVKILHGQWAMDRSRIERFVSGARRVMTLRHEAIVPVLDLGHDEPGLHYFVMPWFGSGDLYRAVKEGRADRRTALAAVARVAEALAFAHAAGVVHRDVKPANILLDEHGEGWVTDFDLAHAKDTTHGTRTGGLGTFAYAAPEQLEDASRIDARADVYSLGMCVLFVLLRKDPPVFPAITSPQSLSELECGDRLREALTRAVAYDPDHRTISCEELAAAIREELAERP